MPKTGSRSKSGRFGDTWIFPFLSDTKPSAVPIHRVPVESISRQFTSGERKPSATEYVRHAPLSMWLKPPGVPNHIDPSPPSAMEEIVFDGRPLVVVYVVKRPSWKTLTPPPRVPAQIAPLRLR